MDKKKDRAGTIMIIIGMVLIAACIGLFVWNLLDAERAREDMDERLNLVIGAIEERLKNPGESSDPGESSTSVSADQKNMPVVKLDGYEYIGYLTVPSVELRIPVMNTCDDRSLRVAGGRYYGSLETDDLVIAAHNYKNGAGKLDRVKLGDEVIFTNMNGKEYHYKVGELEIVQPEQVHEMVESRWELSIYTCTYLGTERFTVRCEMIK